MGVTSFVAFTALLIAENIINFFQRKLSVLQNDFYKKLPIGKSQ